VSDAGDAGREAPGTGSGTLAQRIAQGALPVGVVRRMVKELDVALTRAHDAGLIHGHLTAETVVFEDGVAQLSGLRSTPPAVEGKPRPSRLEDQRAFAAVVYHALAGAPPAHGEDWKPISALRPDVPRALDTVFARGLHRDPASRYPEVPAFARAFEASFERLASPSRPLLALAMLGPLAVLAVGILWAVSGGDDQEDAPPAATIDAGTR